MSFQPTQSRAKKHKGHKFGTKRNEIALKGRKSDKNFKQSRDVHEDRGRVQTEHGRPKNFSR